VDSIVNEKPQTFERVRLSKTPWEQRRRRPFVWGDPSGHMEKGAATEVDTVCSFRKFCCEVKNVEEALCVYRAKEVAGFLRRGGPILFLFARVYSMPGG
jgi:hypothetical protein